MTHIVTVQLMGGLGNQLFQLFVTIAYAMKTGRKIIFPYTVRLGSRITYWDTFLARLKGFTTFSGSSGFSNEQLLRFPMFREQGFEYLEIPHFDEKQVLLFGYFQSYLYFEKVKQKIYDIIQLEKQQENIILEMMDFHKYQDLIGEHSMSMHFRLGDYKNLPEHHPIMPCSYYEAAVEKVMSLRDMSFKDMSSKDMVVYYFCEKEDIEEVMKTIHVLENKYSCLQFVEVDHEIEDWKHMLMMSCCRHNIIANSTFSWWGAYLNRNCEKIVCYPSNWFGPMQGNNTKDLFPREWNQIEVI